jgi:tetratricopeptide (TPR) repeat protein
MFQRLALSGSPLEPEEITYWMNHINAVGISTSEAFFVCGNLSARSFDLFSLRRKREDIDRAISLCRMSIENYRDINPDVSTNLSVLGMYLEERWKYFTEKEGGTGDLEEMIKLRREVLSLRNPGNLGHQMALWNLANALHTRLELTANIGDLTECIALYKELCLRALAGGQVPPIWNSTVLITLLIQRSQRTELELGDRLRDLDDGVSLSRWIVSLAPNGNSEVLIHLTLLLNSIRSRFDLSGTIEDLEEAVSVYDRMFETPELKEPEHPRLAKTLDGQGTLLVTRYERRGSLDDLERAINLHRKSLTLKSNDDPARSLNNLAAALLWRYEEHVSESDIEEALTLHIRALSMRPFGHPDRPETLSNRATALNKRYHRMGKIEDLEESILLLRTATSEMDENHPKYSIALGNLGCSIHDRYFRLGERSDVDEAIEIHQRALTSLPIGHPDRPNCLSDLATALASRGEEEPELQDFLEAIRLHREALELRVKGSIDRPVSLHDLAGALRTAYETSRNMEVLEEAIQLLEEARHLWPSGSPGKTRTLYLLASCMLAKYQRVTTDVALLDNAIEIHNEALETMHLGHLTRAATFHSLALLLHTKVRSNGTNSPATKKDLDQIMQLARNAVNDPAISPVYAFIWARHWATASLDDPQFTAEMHVLSLDFLEQRLLVHPDLVKQQDKLISTADMKNVPSEIAAQLFSQGLVELAVEILDRGRSLLFGILQRYRTPFDRLYAINPELANRLKYLGTELEELATNRHDRLTRGSTKNLNDIIMTRQRERLKEWHELLSQARGLMKGEDLFLHPTFDQLRQAASGGPVIFLNASQSRCDAVIMTCHHPPLLVELPRVKLTSLAKLHSLLNQVKCREGPRARDEMVRILRWLWRTTVSPIVSALKNQLDIQLQSRIWWCPNGWFTLLPIHAAGLYNGAADSNLLDQFISSYISTASNLLRLARETQIANEPSNPMKLLYVGNGLDTIEADLTAIREAIPGMAVHSVLGEYATRDAVLRYLSDEADQQAHVGVHFVCHGLTSANSPLDSHFQLQDGDLTVKDIIVKRRNAAEFAFLAACCSADPGSGIPDEAIHLASALQLSGFRSVVGTMWEMFDFEGTAVTKDFYTELSGKHTNAAEAIHHAIKKCRDRCLARKDGTGEPRPDGPERWAMFIHIGA